MRWVGHVARREGEKRGIYRVLVRKPGRKRSLGRPWSRWEDNIKMDLQEMGRGAWTGLIWLRVGQVAGSCKCGFCLSLKISPSLYRVIKKSLYI
jgi:hypothetical protein